MSARGEYRKPTAETPWEASLETLARELKDLARQATDPYELAAHLEVLGYNRYRVQKTFGLPDTFALARTLFALWDRDTQPRTRVPRVEKSLHLRHLAVALTLLGTLLVFLPLAQVGWLAALFLLAWSQLAARVGQRVAVRLEGARAERVLAATLWLGLLGLTLLAPLDRAAWASWSVGLAWLGVAIFTLKAKERQALLFAASFFLLAASAWVLHLPHVVLGLPLFLTVLRETKVPDREAVAFLGEILPEEWAYPAYGLGQGLILWQLVTLSREGTLLGLVLYLLASLLVELQLARFVRRLGESLWQKKDPKALLLAVQRTFWAYFLTALGPTALTLLALPFAEGYTGALLGFGLLNLVSAMGLGLNALAGAPVSALGLLSGALLLHLGQDPLILGAVGLGLGLLLLEHLRHPERYAIYLL